MKNLPRTAKKECIIKLLEPFGEVDDVYYDDVKRIAIVRVDYKENAEKAVQKLNKINWRGSVLKVQFSAPLNYIKLRNLSPFVTNELLKYGFSVFGSVEKALVAVDHRGKPTGEGIVEFNRKHQAKLAVTHCTENLFFLTTSPRPVIAEHLSSVCDGEGFKDRVLKTLTKSNMSKKYKKFLKERQMGPRFAESGTFEYEHGEKWKKLFEVYDAKRKDLEKEFLEQERQLLDELEKSEFVFKTELPKQQVEERKAEIESKNIQKHNKSHSINDSNQTNDDDDFDFEYESDSNGNDLYSMKIFHKNTESSSDEEN